MLLWLLLHLAVHHLLTSARNAPSTNVGTIVPMNQPNVRHIDSCPDVGYFFRREAPPNTVTQGPCFLCFCHGEKQALCWERDNKRCDVESFHYHGIGKRNTRIRRSPNPDPFGLSDIFFRDAARSLFNKQPEQQCKPHESSFSEGCPPADWCTGCTVCDCNANGQWDCHTLSFCPDDNQNKKKKGGPKVPPPKPRPIPRNQPYKTTKRIVMSTTKKTPAKKNMKAYVPIVGRRLVANQGNKNTQGGVRVVKKIVQKKITKKPNEKSPKNHWKPGNSQKNIDSRNQMRPKFVNRYKATSKSTKVKRSPNSQMNEMKPMNEIRQIPGMNQQNETVRVAQEIFKRVMAAVKKMVGNQMKNLTQKIYGSEADYRARNIEKRETDEKEIINNEIQTKFMPKKNSPAHRYRIRNKRDILSVMDIKNCSIQEVTEEPLLLNVTDTTEDTVDTISVRTADDQNAFTRNSNETDYFRYVTESNLTTDSPIALSSVYKSETVLNLISTERVRNLAPEQNENITNSLDSLIDNIPTGNDLKFNDWSYLKTLKERHLKNVTIIKNESYIERFINETDEDIGHHKNKVHSKDVERKLMAKKYNIVKVVTTHRSLFDDKDQANIHQSIKSKINDLHKTVRKLFKNFYRSSRTQKDVMTNKKRNFKRSGLIKYMKNFFNKVFKRDHCKNDQQLVQSLCNTFGPCELSKSDKIMLKSKLKELNKETITILKAIKIVKGLLKLLDIPTSNVSESNKISPEHDLRKLDTILKGKYQRNDSYNMSYSQLTQIDYIKKNTQDFLQSIGKFANTLNSIVTIITKHKRENTKKIHLILRKFDEQDTSVSSDPFKSMRNLISNYNFVHNRFMRKITDALNAFETKMKKSESKLRMKKETKANRGDSQNLNKTVAIEVFSRNIINNLRRLKNVASTLSYNGRNKREIPRSQRDDDSMNYLLMLMEYLMKQSHPLSDAPVNDGIDLLIEAIKSAPDIKSIQKKVLVYTPASPKKIPTRVTTEINEVNSIKTERNEVNPFIKTELNELNSRISTEINEVNPTVNDKDDNRVDNAPAPASDDNEIETKETLEIKRLKMQPDDKNSEVIYDEEKENEEKYLFDRKVDAKTESSNFETIDGYMENDTAKDVGVTTQKTAVANENNVNADILDYDNLYKLKSVVGDNTDKHKEYLSKKENNGVDGDENLNKVEESVEIKRKNSNQIMNEDELASSFYNEVVPKAQTVTRASAEKSVTKGPSVDSESSEVATKNNSADEPVTRTRNKHTFDLKSPIDWIEENFALDPKTVPPVVIFTRSSTTELIREATIKPEVTHIGMTNEMMTAEEKKKKKEINTEEVIFRKQMDLLNSLDYGTERTEADDLDSKDERSASDSFPTYF